MSKIEDALRRARASREGGAPTSAQLVPINQQTLVVRRSGDNLVTLARSKAEIARMVEPWQLSKEARLAQRVIHLDMEDGRVTRAFRELRTRIVQHTNGEGCVLLVAPVVPRSGGGFVARNLAAAFALDESKTALFIDCNLSDPALFSNVAGEAPCGLLDYLADESVAVESIIHPVGITRLRVIPTGARRELSGEPLGSIRMRQLIEALRIRYADRYIVISAPPVSHSADSRILAELSDHALLVTRYGTVTPSELAAAAREIGEQKLFGVVLNDEPQLPIIDWREVLAGAWRDRGYWRDLVRKGLEAFGRRRARPAVPGASPADAQAQTGPVPGPGSVER